MAFNPITALSEQLQKLITEHGSAAILRDHLALFKDQLIVREKEFAALASEIAKLKDKIKALESQLDNASEEIERQNQVIKTLQEAQGSKKYDPTTNEVIKLFFEAGRELSIDEIVGALSVDISTARYHLDLLIDNGLVEETTNVFMANSPEAFSITKAGRRYIMKT